MSQYESPILDDSQAGYYQLPKHIVQDHRYKGMSNKSKMLYALMLDRMRLSELNHWKDQNEKIYIYFTIESIASELNVSLETAVKCRKELIHFELVEVQKNGFKKADRLYIKKVEDIDFAESSRYYRIPRFLFRSHQYQKLSIDAKILYAILADRKFLMDSIEKMDMNIEISVRKEVTRDLSCSKDKALRLMKDLRNLGLIQKTETKKGVVDTFCIGIFTSLLWNPKKTEDEVVAKPEHIEEKDVNFNEEQASSVSKVVAKTESICLKKCGKEDGVVAKSEPQWSQNPSLSGCKTRTQVVAKPECNKTLSVSSFSDRTLSTTSSLKKEKGDTYLKECKEQYYSQTKAKIKTQIDYHNICGSPFLLGKEVLDEYVSLITEVLCSQKRFYSINGEDIPGSIVRQAFSKINTDHLVLANHSIVENDTPVYHLKPYLISLFYNAITLYHTAKSIGGL